MRPDADAGPDPTAAQSAAEFVALLRALRQWSGFTFRQIEHRAKANGDVLPHSTVSSALGRTTLPREELMAMFVRAVGCDDETVELWTAARRRLAAASELASQEADWWPPPAPRAEEPQVEVGPAEMAPVELSIVDRSSETVRTPVALMEDEAEIEAEVEAEVEADTELPPLGIRPRPYQDGTLAEAVKRRRRSESWIGLHRRAAKSYDGEPSGSRFGFKDLVPPVIWRAGWSTRVMFGVLAFVLLLIAAGAISRGIRDGELARPPGDDGGTCCVDGDEDEPGDGMPGDPSAQPSDKPSGQTPSPRTTPTLTKPIVNPTPPKPTTTTTGPPASEPRLSGSASPTCVRRGSEWWVDIPISASLSGASSGTSPTAMAGEADALKTFTLNGSGSTSFSGQTSVYVGQYSEFVTQFGNITWSVTVSLPDRSKIGTSGREGYRCN